MSRLIDPAVAKLLRQEFAAFVSYAFREQEGEPLQQQLYVELLCYEVSLFIAGENRRLLVNLPPQHLKSFVCTICLAAFLLGKNPRLRILVVGYKDEFAGRLANFIRAVMDTSWYQQVFSTRIKPGHDRARDFATTEGGYIFAAGAQGLTGYTADVIIYDDPHEYTDWQNERAKAAVRDNFAGLMSRLQNKVRGRVIVVAHRVAEDDLSAQLINDPRWRRLQLPFIAPRAKTYQLGKGRIWERHRGDILRPDAYPAEDIKWIKKQQVSPPYALYHQQGIDKAAFRAILASHFCTFEKHEVPIAPVVLSIDPGQSGGVNASRSAIQAWKSDGKFYYLIDQSCDQYDFAQLVKEVRRFIRLYNPSVVLIEKTANGPALYAELSQTKPQYERILIVPRETKAARLERHRAKILRRQIRLPADAIWTAPFVDEIVGFPGEFDDQMDAMTQYLDFMAGKPIIKSMPPREHGIGVAFGSQRPRPW